LVLGLLHIALPVEAQSAARQLVAPPAEAPDTNKPVKVFILMGQSNMVGFGDVGPRTNRGTLAFLTGQEDKYPWLLDGKGDWVERNDVWCVKTTVGPRQGWLSPVFGASPKLFGPELGFGWVMGQIHSEPVLLIKASQGNRSLGWDFLPPGSVQFEHQGRTYAGYKDTPDWWNEGQPKRTVNWYAGKQYDDCIRDIHDVLNNLPKYFPSYQGQGYEIGGFVWWQGHKDQGEPYAARYEGNLVRLIKSLRTEFKSPHAPFVLGTIGFEGWKLAGQGLTVANAQLAVSDAKRYPEFAGNVQTVEARGFWREKEDSPNQRQGYHYYHNAETYFKVGESLGWAMAGLLAPKN